MINHTLNGHMINRLPYRKKMNKIRKTKEIYFFDKEFKKPIKIHFKKIINYLKLNSEKFKNV
jgi:hypothetical protein